ncbi:MAG TPA: polysaccharide deacetylase family protein, partial [Thermoleophilaceae bacterium]|nr:polysaccharide deacetylase family protein [Thermoleophilaceae bacterium]
MALTFDDGPGRVTAPVLEVLAGHGVHATFNVLGERVADHTALLRRLVGEGHEVGNHAFHHERLAGRPLEALRQMTRTNAVVSRAAGVGPRVFRAPYGSV